MSTPKQPPLNGPVPPHEIASLKKLDFIARVVLMVVIFIMLTILGYVLTKIPITSTIEVTRKGSPIHLPVWLGLLMAPGIFGLILYQTSKDPTTKVTSRKVRIAEISLFYAFCFGGIWAQWGIGQKYIIAVLGG